MEDKWDESAQCWGLIIDVEGAHNLIPIQRCEWRYLCCRVEGERSVLMHAVGTFGVPSAACWWSGVGGSFSRLAQYIIGITAPQWLLLVADDLDAEASGPCFRQALASVVLLAVVVDLPISISCEAGRRCNGLGSNLG